VTDLGRLNHEDGNFTLVLKSPTDNLLRWPVDEYATTATTLPVDVRPEIAYLATSGSPKAAAICD